MKRTKPRITCLMVSSPRGRRFPLFQRSIDCFLKQTYPNKELLVVLNNMPQKELRRATRYLSSLKKKNIRWEWAGQRKTLGQLRNISLKLATSPILCQWDDDDISHPQRLERQERFLQRQGGGLVYLQEIFHFFPAQRALYWLDWSRNFSIPGMPSTVMFSRDIDLRYPETGPFCRRGEDTAFYFWARAAARFPIGFLQGAPELYTYVFHGENVWKETHHTRTAMLFSVSRRKLLHWRKKILRDLRKLKPLAAGISVMGAKGLAYELRLD